MFGASTTPWMTPLPPWPPSPLVFSFPASFYFVPAQPAAVTIIPLTSWLSKVSTCSALQWPTTSYLSCSLPPGMLLWQFPETLHKPPTPWVHVLHYLSIPPGLHFSISPPTPVVYRPPCKHASLFCFSLPLKHSPRKMQSWLNPMIAYAVLCS